MGRGSAGRIIGNLRQRVAVMALAVSVATVGLVALTPPPAAHADQFCGGCGNYEPGYWHEGPTSSNGIDRSQWMKALTNTNLRLSDLTLPGTHDSATWDWDHMEFPSITNTQDIIYGILGAVALAVPGYGALLALGLGAFALLNGLALPAIVRTEAQAQTMDLPTQLKAGVRALDFRLGQVSGSSCDSTNLWAVHGKSVCIAGTTFADELSKVKTFLINNPSETVVIRVDSDSGMDPKTFEQMAEATMNDPTFKPWIFNAQIRDPSVCPDPSDRTNLKCLDMNPTLGAASATNPPITNEMRGHMVMLQDWGTTQSPWFTIPYPQSGGDKGFSLQDNYTEPTYADLGWKWNDVKTEFQSAATGPESMPYINYMSTSGGAFPYFFAGGKGLSGNTEGAPQLATAATPSDCGGIAFTDPPYICQDDDFGGGGFYSDHGFLLYFKGIDQLALEHIDHNKQWDRLGIVYADFPGPGHWDPDQSYYNSLSYYEQQGLIGMLIGVNFRVHPITATGTAVTATEGEHSSGQTASFTVPDSLATASNYSATIDWGDGTSTSTGTVSGPTGGPFSVTGSHTYAEEGVYTVTTSITANSSSNPVSTTSKATVGDAALSASCATPFMSALAYNGSVASFTDGNTVATTADFTTSIDWGDGITSPGTVSGSTGGPFTVSSTHTYASVGRYVTYTIKVSITDDGGSTANTGSGCNVIVGNGEFVVGSKAATVGSSVNFWGSQWSKNNPLAGGSAPNSFKGFAISPTTPTCGSTYLASTTGNSPPPPLAPLPPQILMIVTSSMKQVGSTIVGIIAHVVMVQTNPGYGPAPGHTGTGRVVSVLC